jgi:hypothetical protein
MIGLWVLRGNTQLARDVIRAGHLGCGTLDRLLFLVLTHISPSPGFDTDNE